jgi:hypothetical protein
MISVSKETNITKKKKAATPQKSCKGFLTKPMKEYVTSKDKKGYNTSEYDRRLIGYAKLSLKNDLPFLAENLDEEMQAKIFNEENLLPFLYAVFSPRYKDPKMSEKEREQRRKRIVRLSQFFINSLGTEGAVLAPKSLSLLNKNIPMGLRAILMENCSEDEG